MLAHVAPDQSYLHFDLDLHHFTELSHIFFDPTTPDKVSEYDRIKQDLDKSVRENRHLSRQMEQWKRQLAEETSSGKSCPFHTRKNKLVKTKETDHPIFSR